LAGNQRRMCCPAANCSHNSIRERKARHVGRAGFGPQENDGLTACCQVFSTSGVECGAADRNPFSGADAISGSLADLDEPSRYQPAAATFQRCRVNAKDHGGVALQESTSAVSSEPGITSHAHEAVHHSRRAADVEDRIQHPRHRLRRA
jgi:hypothetical protein